MSEDGSFNHIALRVPAQESHWMRCVRLVGEKASGIAQSPWLSSIDCWLNKSQCAANTHLSVRFGEVSEFS